MFVWTRSGFSDNFIFFMVFRCFLANIFTKYSAQIMTRLFARSQGGSWLVSKVLNRAWESNESVGGVEWEAATAEADRNAVWEGDCWALQQVIHWLFLFPIRSHHGNVVSAVWTTTRAAHSQRSCFLRQQFFREWNKDVTEAWTLTRRSSWVNHRPWNTEDVRSKTTYQSLHQS